MILGFFMAGFFSEPSDSSRKKRHFSGKSSRDFWELSFNAPVLHAYKSLFSNLNFADGGFALDLGLKDMRLLHISADRARVAMPVLDHLHEKLLASMNLGREKYDWSAIMLLTRELAD